MDLTVLALVFAPSLLVLLGGSLLALARTWHPMRQRHVRIRRSSKAV